jgi:hypothetical protein
VSARARGDAWRSSLAPSRWASRAPPVFQTDTPLWATVASRSLPSQAMVETLASAWNVRTSRAESASRSEIAPERVLAPMARNRPSGLNDAAGPDAARTDLSICPVRASQKRIWRSDPAVASTLPSGRNASVTRPASPGAASWRHKSRPPAEDTSTPPPSRASANVRPSGVNTAPVIRLRGAASDRPIASSAPVSHSLALPEASAVASDLPSGLNATVCGAVSPVSVLSARPVATSHRVT